LRKGERGQFALDASVALVVLTAIAVLGATALGLAAERTDWRAGVAVAVADALANRCAPLDGLARCEGAWLYSAELGDSPDLEVLGARYSLETNATIVVFVGTPPGGVCARRLYAYAGETISGGACVT